MKNSSKLILLVLLLTSTACATRPSRSPIAHTPKTAVPTAENSTAETTTSPEEPGASTASADAETNAASSDTSTASSDTSTADAEAQAIECPSVPRDYLKALAMARRPKQKDISRELWALLQENKKLVWNQQGQVLMTTWTNPKFYPPDTYQKGYEFPLYGDTFLTAVPEMEEWCAKYAQQNPSNLDYRLYQFLGLPPPQPGAYQRQFVELWVSPENLFRPCADPEITDHECQTSIPFLGAKSPPTPTTEPPWLCPNPFLPPQVTGAFSQVNAASLSWICSWWETAYGNECPDQNYPWTALGYTFDWGDLVDPKGASEFVALGKSMVIFESMTPTAEYCGLDAEGK